MIVEKNGDTSARKILLTTGTITDNSHTASAYSSLKLEMAVTTDKVYFPGKDTYFAARYESHKDNSFISLKGNDGTYKNTGGNSDSWNYFSGNDGFYTYDNKITDLEPLYRIRNWADYSTYPNSPYDNFNYRNTSTALAYNYENIDEEYVEEIGTFSIHPNSNYWDNYWNPYIAGRTEGYLVEFRPQVINGVTSDDVGLYTAYNLHSPTQSGPGFETTGTFNGKNLKAYFQHTSYPDYDMDTYTLSEVTGVSQVHTIITKKKKVEYASALKTKLVNCFCNNPNMTGTNVTLRFDNTGYNVIGTASLYSTTAEVTAGRVSYLYYTGHSANTGSVDNYVWHVTGYTDYDNGGGGYSISFSSYYPAYNSKYVLPCKNSNTKYYTITNDNCYYEYSANKIQHSYGGCILFSGDNLDNYWNSNNKYLYVGFKGVSYLCDNGNFSTITGALTNTANNWEAKIYKFNSDYFKKVQDNVYYFEDDDIARVNNASTPTRNNSYYKIHIPVGPCFYAFNNTSAYTKNNGTTSANFKLDSSNLIPPPVTLNVCQYITTIDVDDEKASEYIVAKPANSIQKPTSFVGHLYNYGNTNTYNYLKFNVPDHVIMYSLYLNSNITELTKLGKTLQSITGLYSNGTLSNLTAIKENFGWGMNLKQMNGTFNGATKLKILPNSWGNLGRLEQAYSLFQGCNSLTSLPDFYNLGKLSGASNMFCDCTNISSFPNGPLTALTNGEAMFRGCTNLTGAPVSWTSFCPHLTAANEMFANTKITDIPTDLFQTDLSAGGFQKMFMNCTALTSDIGNILNYIDNNFDAGSTGLYGSAFKGCTGVRSGTKTYAQITANASTTIRNVFGL